MLAVTGCIVLPLSNRERVYPDEWLSRHREGLPSLRSLQSRQVSATSYCSGSREGLKLREGSAPAGNTIEKANRDERYASLLASMQTTMVPSLPSKPAPRSQSPPLISVKRFVPTVRLTVRHRVDHRVEDDVVDRTHPGEEPGVPQDHVVKLVQG